MALKAVIKDFGKIFFDVRRQKIEDEQESEHYADGKGYPADKARCDQTDDAGEHTTEKDDPVEIGSV